MRLDERPRQNTDTAARRIGGLFYVVDPSTSELHSFNEVGSFIWELLDGTKTVSGIVDAVVSSYEVDRPRAERGVAVFLDQLQAKNLVEV